MSDGSNERYPSVALKNGAISIFTKIKGIEVVRNTNEVFEVPNICFNVGGSNQYVFLSFSFLE